MVKAMFLQSIMLWPSKKIIKVEYIKMFIEGFYGPVDLFLVSGNSSGNVLVSLYLPLIGSTLKLMLKISVKVLKKM